MTVAELRNRFTAAPVQCMEGKGGLPCLKINTDLAEATIYLHGAQVTHYQPRGQKPVLFMSDSACFAADKPIRGGVPICFPWFGPRPGGQSGPAHGFARLQQWDVTQLSIAGDGTVDVILQLTPTNFTRSLWPGEFSLQYRIRIARDLQMTLRVANLADEALTIQEALHTYFVVGDIHRTSVTGLAGVSYLDKVDGAKPKVQGPSPITFTAETDRVYLNTQSTCVIHDPTLGRKITLAKTGSDATVLWNPWTAKSKTMSDFGDEEWPGMLCVETANVADNTLTLAPNASHTMEATISVDTL